MNLSNVAKATAAVEADTIQFKAIISSPNFQLETEIWTQDSADANLWHGPAGVIVNTSALEERKAFYQVITQK